MPVLLSAILYMNLTHSLTEMSTRNISWGKDGRKMDLREVGGGRGDWMELAQDRDGWRALVGTVKNFRGSINAGNFLTSGKVYWLASQEGLCSME